MDEDFLSIRPRVPFAGKISDPQELNVKWSVKKKNKMNCESGLLLCNTFIIHNAVDSFNLFNPVLFTNINFFVPLLFTN